MRLAALLLAALLAGCATRMGADGRPQTSMDAKYLAKTEVDRVADAARSEVNAGLMRLADKLYRRNPKEWKKGGAATREEALERLRTRTNAFPALAGRQEAAGLAFREDYGSDRVAALMLGLLAMADSAFENKDEYFLLDSLDEQKLYNCARNFEIAVWKLAMARDGAGDALLLSNELDPAHRNLSFEREFGRLIGLLDFLSNIIADKNGRTVTRLTQSVATAVFLPVGLVK